jgi:hypothetical protein
MKAEADNSVDQTGLTGKYGLILKWMPDTSPPPTLNGEADTSAPSICWPVGRTALERSQKGSRR